MDFGLLMMPDAAAAAAQARLAEAHGFSHYWVADSELMAADPYVALATAAVATKRIVLGTGVAIAGSRIAPVTACAIASIGALAPGRVVLGLGTGNSARRAMGMPPYRVSQLREHVRVVRGLLGGGEVDYREGELNRSVRFFHQQLQLINTCDRIPIYIAGNAPRAIELAGEMGDGFITSRTNTVQGWRETWAQARTSAERAGRNPQELYTMLLTATCLLRPGEDYDSPRVRTEAGPWAMVALHAVYESVKSVEAAPAAIRATFAAYKEYADHRLANNPAYYMKLHDGHGLYLQPGEERFVTAELIRHATMTATPQDLILRLRALEAEGVRQVAFIPTPASVESFAREFGEEIIARMRVRSGAGEGGPA
ncbi:MAG TPA: LLM class flavin-dependent oxidoreductase [Candidatus Binataceae bacterium]|nr:LLM class flavin-dependent oxidoreductase [Candidatus Binataceae bacterium]